MRQLIPVGTKVFAQYGDKYAATPQEVLPTAHYTVDDFGVEFELETGLTYVDVICFRSTERYPVVLFSRCPDYLDVMVVKRRTFDLFRYDRGRIYDLGEFPKVVLMRRSELLKRFSVVDGGC